MTTIKFISIFLLNLSIVFLLRKANQSDYFSQFSLNNTLRLLTASDASKTFKDKACQNTDLTGYLATASDKDSTEFTYDMLTTSRNGENRLKNMLKNKTSISTEEFQTYGMSLLAAAIPIGVLFIFSLFSCWIYCSCLCCKCCPLNCCRCCKKVSPVTKTDLQCPGIFSFIMGLGVLATAIAALIFNEKFQIGYNKVQCSTATSLDTIIAGMNTTDGNITYRFLGIEGANEKLSLIINSFNDTILSINNNFNDTDWVDSDAIKLQQQIQNIYENNYNQVVTTCDPTDKISTVVPDYFKTLGPSTETLSVTFKLNTEFNVTTKVVSESLSSIKNSSQNLVSSSDVYLNSLQSGKSSINDFYITTEGYVNSASNSTDSINKIFEIIYYVIIALLSFAILCSILGMLGCFCSTCCHMAKFRYCTHWAWFGLSLFAILIFLISILLIPFSIVLMESCGVINDAFSNSTEMKTYALSVINSADYDRIDVCLFQNGDINKLYNISTSLESIHNLTKSFNSFQNVSLNGSIIISNESQYVEKVISFKVDAINPTASSYSNPSYVINNLNQWSDYSITNSEQVSHCSVSQDQFVFNYNDCSSSYSAIFDTSLATTQNFKYKTCINIGDLGTNDTYAASRYGTEFDNCTEVTDNAVGTNVSGIYLAELKQLYKYQSGINTSFTSLSNDYNTYNDLNNKYQSNLTNLANKTINEFKNNINDVLDYVSNNETGLIAGLNCSFLKTSADSLVESTCVVFIPSFYQLMILILITGGFAFFMAIALLRNGLMVKKSLNLEGEQPDVGYTDPNGAYPKYAID